MLRNFRAVKLPVNINTLATKKPKNKDMSSNNSTNNKNNSRQTNLKPKTDPTPPLELVSPKNYKRS